MNSALKILSIACMMSLVACSPATDSPSTDGRSESPVSPSAPATNAEPTPTPTPAAGPNTLTFNELDKIRYGMSKDEFLALKIPHLGASEMTEGADSCHSYMLRKPAETTVMIEKKRVTRIDAGPGLNNALGVKVGDSMASVIAKYPDAVMSTLRTNPRAKVATIWNDDKTSGFVLQSNAQGNVELTRSGIAPNLAYDEGCA